MAFGRSMGIIIRGFAERVASSVNDWVAGMTDSGASDDTIKRRLKEEIEAGRIIGEMKRFANSYVPGYVGTLAERFGRDTLANKKLAADLLAEVRAGTRSREDAEAVKDALRAEGVDTSALGDAEDGQLPDIPPETDLNERFYWVAIHDKNTCDVCEDNSRLGAKTLGEWVDIGEPRSGACRGEQNCRCVLVPADDLPAGGIPGSIEIPRVPKDPSKV